MVDATQYVSFVHKYPRLLVLYYLPLLEKLDGVEPSVSFASSCVRLRAYRDRPWRNHPHLLL